MSILVVDDHQCLQLLLTTFLEDAGYEAVTADNGVEALEYLRQSIELPGLILLDIAMPKMTGWEFVRQQQGDVRLASIPVVLMTALGHIDNPEATPSVVTTIEKPIDLTHLAAIVNTYYRPQLKMAAVRS
jgi:CheY-like chemotaxis protein